MLIVGIYFAISSCAPSYLSKESVDIEKRIIDYMEESSGSYDSKYLVRMIGKYDSVTDAIVVPDSVMEANYTKIMADNPFK